MNSEHKSTLSRREFLRLSAAAAVGGMAAACAKTPEPTSPPAATTAPPTATLQPTATTAAAAPTAPADPWAIYPPEDPRHWLLDELIEPEKVYDGLVVTQNYHIANSVYKEGEAPDDNVKTRWLKEKTGVEYKAVWSGPNFNDYWPIALASGDLPDLMTNVTQVVYLQLREADMLEDITDIWESTASDLTKKKKHYPDYLWWKVYNDKGRYYCMPTTGGGAYNGENVFWVRQDWLDKVGLAFPTTLDEVEEVGKAFVTDGLSQYGLWINGGGRTGWGSCDYVYGAFGTIPQIWRRGSDGRLAYTSLEPAQKDALDVLARWYKDGILNPEFLAATDGNKEIGGNLMGMAGGAWWWAVVWLRTSVANDPTANWMYGDVPTGPGGVRTRWGNPNTDLSIAFRKGVDRQKIEAFITGLNWFYAIEDKEVTGNTGNIIRFLGYDYEMEGDKVVTGDFSTNRYNPGPFGFNGNRYPELDLRGYGLAVANSQKDPATLNPLQQYYAQDPQFTLAYNALQTAFAGASYRMVTDYLWPVPADAIELQQTLTNLEAEAYAKVVTGQEPVDYWDTFVDEWTKQGGDRLTGMINDEDAKHA